MAKKEKRGKEIKSKVDRKRGIASKVKLLLLLMPVIALLTMYMRVDISKKRFIKHLLKQVPYLPGRYFA